MEQTVCICERCVRTKLNSAIKLIELYNDSSCGTPKHRLKEMEDEHIFRVAGLIRVQLESDLEISNRFKQQGLLH